MDITCQFESENYPTEIAYIFLSALGISGI